MLQSKDDAEDEGDRAVVLDDDPSIDALGPDGSPDVLPIMPSVTAGCFAATMHPLRFYFSLKKLLQCWPLVLFGLILGILGVTQITISLTSNSNS
jgi:hypothetical protein